MLCSRRWRYRCKAYQNSSRYWLLSYEIFFSELMSDFWSFMLLKSCLFIIAIITKLLKITSQTAVPDNMWTMFRCYINWRAPWKNRISSTSMKLRKSLVKPVTWQNIYIDLFGFFHPRSSCTMHLMLFSERPPIYVSLCMTILAERTKQLDIFCRITGFEWFSSAANVCRYIRRAWRSPVKEPYNTL